MPLEAWFGTIAAALQPGKRDVAHTSGTRQRQYPREIRSIRTIVGAFQPGFTRLRPG